MLNILLSLRLHQPTHRRVGTGRVLPLFAVSGWLRISGTHNPVDRFFIMVVAMGGCHQSCPARHHQFEHRNAARRVVAGNEEMDPELSELDDLLGRIDAVLWPFPVPDSFLLRGSSSLHPANSRPYCEAASSILCISRYPGSSAGGKVMAGAGTLNSLNHPSSPAGVSRMSIRSCSDSIVNEWPRSR